MRPDLEVVTGDRDGGASGPTADEQSMPRTAAVFAALFVVLFVLTYVLGANVSQEAGKIVGLASFGCLFIMLGVCFVQEADEFTDYVIIAGIVAVMVGIGAAGVFIASLFVPMPWALLGIIPAVFLVALYVLVRGVLIAKFSSKVEEAEEGYRYD